MATTKSIRVIDHTERLNNSRSGNPRYRVTFTDGSRAITKSDSQVAYDIQNLSHSRYEGAKLEIIWTKAGRIENIEIVEMRAEPETQEHYNDCLRYVNLNN